MTQATAYLGVARAPFLALPVALVACGAAVAAWEGGLSWPRTLLALLGLVALHVAVNVFNEVSDLRTGIDLRTTPTPFSGGSGTLPAAALSPRAATVFGVLAAAVGLGAGLALLPGVGWRLLPVMAVGAVAVLGYTDALARVGLGEVFAGLGLGALPVWGTVLVQGGRPGPAAVAAAVPAFFMTFNLLLLNEFPDEEADRSGGRRNLVILLGRRAAAFVYALAALLTPVSIAAAVALRVLPGACFGAVFPSLLLVRPLRWALAGSHEPVPVPALAANVTWNLATNIALALTLLLASR